jgi:3',5'-cyclic AMP phosphodiesterase CpdA
VAFRVKYPDFARNRGPHFWLWPANLIAARVHWRADKSSEWRDDNERSIYPHPVGANARTKTYHYLLPDLAPTLVPEETIRVIILGDTGEGDASQYGLLPLIRALKPHFMIIAGDVAYPAGRSDDYTEGFFRPYNNLKIPIWAVPGNHEYYSSSKGREFVEVFCSRKRVEDWSLFGLRFVPQPGTYWELAESGFTNVRILGIDTGHSGKLDSNDAASSDARQIGWLEDRLAEANEAKEKVILLFHIPVLVDGKLADEPQLVRLHELIASSQSVKAVICGHIHNFQIYEPAVFATALRAISGVPFPHEPAYVVSGGGGSFLSIPPKGESDYKWKEAFPDRTQWERLTGRNLRQKTLAVARRGIAKVSLSQSLVDRALASIEEAGLYDKDKSALLSFLLVEIKKDGATITPVFLKDLTDLYPGILAINIQNDFPPPDASRVEDCKKHKLAIQM